MLRHVLLVAGTVAEWAGYGEDEWARRVSSLGETARHAGASWLTVRPYAQGDDAAGAGAPADAAGDADRREHLIGDDERTGCTVVVDPTVDGRTRFAAAMAELDPAEPVDESSVAAALYRPALAEPDLVLVLGPDDRLPASLVWELGYAELVFIDRNWSELEAADLTAAIDEYSSRSRRFGGLP